VSGTAAQRGAVDEEGLERSIREVGSDLASAFPSGARHPLRAIDQRAMDLASADQELKAALFRFVDVTPACRSLDDLARHLQEFLREVPEAPPPLAVAMRMADNRAGRRAIGAAAAAGVRHMAHRFIVGESPASALGVLRELWNRGVTSSVDLLGEATVTQTEADRYAARCDEALADLAQAQAGWPVRDVLERDSAGPVPRTNVSVKISALTPLLRPDAPERGRRDAAERLRPLLRHADELGRCREAFERRVSEVLDLFLDFGVQLAETFTKNVERGLNVLLRPFRERLRVKESPGHAHRKQLIREFLRHGFAVEPRAMDRPVPIDTALDRCHEALLEAPDVHSIRPGRADIRRAHRSFNPLPTLVFLFFAAHSCRVLLMSRNL